MFKMSPRDRDGNSSFLNVDLHIRSRASLEPLLSEWSQLVHSSILVTVYAPEDSCDIS